MDAELAEVPAAEGSWNVEWLENRAGLLGGSALPGEGLSIVAAHNTLGTEKAGPFLLLNTLERNDTVLVSGSDGSVQIFRVFANELLKPGDMEKLASVAGEGKNTLVLVTCENESSDGGYLDRRVIFAGQL